MKATRFAVTSLLMAALIAALAVAPAVAASSEIEDSERFKDAQQFRQDFGLDATKAVILESLRDREAYPNRDWGVPLSPEEGADMDRRVEERGAIVPAIELARTSDDFVDMFIDQERGGVFVFQYTRDLEAHAAALAEVIPEGIRFELIPVEFTAKQLRMKQEHITADMIESDWLLDGEIEIVEVGDGVLENRVMVGLLHAEDEEQARSILWTDTARWWMSSTSVQARTTRSRSNVQSTKAPGARPDPRGGQSCRSSRPG